MAHDPQGITHISFMQHYSPENRILSLDVRSKTLAYAFFEDATELLDFSVGGSVQSGFHAHRVEKLVRKFQPEVIVLRKIPADSSRDTPATRAAIKSIRAKARSLSRPVVSITQRQIAVTFQPHCKPTKQQIAVLLAACFQALTWYVPRERKAWKPEDRRMHYFDAAAVGMAYFASKVNAEVVHQLLSEAEPRSRLLAREA
jgi:hypothetical protein